MTDTLKVYIFEHDIAWEDIDANLGIVQSELSAHSDCDLFVLPEMFATGFTFKKELAEDMQGRILTCIRAEAAKHHVGIAGSFLCQEGGRLYNRAFFIADGSEHFYDKRHLFGFGKEAEYLTPGAARCVFDFRGWKVSLAVCYDLRFPVWLRNVGNEYDILLLVANWPVARQGAWNALLVARSIENMAYVVGANRTGCDGQGLEHQGGSLILNPKGQAISEKLGNGVSAILSKTEMERFRCKFPVWKDADRFTII